MNPLNWITRRQRRRDWVAKTYTPFGWEQKEKIFMSVARYAHINRPIEGYYFEFGSHGAFTMRLAWDSLHHLLPWDYVAFDSFDGLPEISDIDKMKIWEKGKLKTSEDSFLGTMRTHGMPQDRLTTVKGFYSDSLTAELRDRLLPKQAGFIYVDCDLYLSTVDVLAFCKDFLQVGTILAFDDWNCFYGDPDRGERRAFREFCEANPDISFEPFVSTNEQMSFICLGTEQQRRERHERDQAL